MKINCLAPGNQSQNNDDIETRCRLKTEKQLSTEY